MNLNLGFFVFETTNNIPGKFISSALIEYFVDTIKFNTITLVMADFRNHFNHITILGFQSNAYFDEMRFQSWF